MKQIAFVMSMLLMSVTASIAQISVKYDTAFSRVVGTEIVTQAGTKTTVIAGDGMQYTLSGDGGPGVVINVPKMMSKTLADGINPGKPMVDIEGTRTILGIEGCTGKTGPGPFYRDGKKRADATLEVWFCVEPETQIQFMAEYKIVLPGLTTFRSIATQVAVLKKP